MITAWEEVESNTFDGLVEWYGFKPKTNMGPAGEGYVDRSDRTSQINYTVSLNVDDGILRAAINQAVNKYRGKTYVVSMVDCVSFTADLARNAG